MGLPFLAGCTHAIPRFGLGGRYNEGREEVTRTRGGNVDKAIVALESVVREDPTYKDSLTLLARAYYKRARYEDARMFLQRALAVDSDDEIAWLVLGMTQLRLGENGRGMETLRSGLTLLSKRTTEGYRGYRLWDLNGVVKTSIRRSIVLALKGLEEKEDLIRSGERILQAIDDEDWHQNIEKTIEKEGYSG